MQIGGPTGAFVVIIYDIVQRTGYEGLCVSTLFASLILVLLGIFRIGSLIKYIPQSLVIGFTSGIAVIIFSTQVKDFFGLSMQDPPPGFIAKWISYFHAFPTLQLATFGLAISTLGLILLIRKRFPSIPWGIAAIGISTLVVFIFQIPVETIHSRFGELPRSIPLPSLSHFSIPIGQFKEIIRDGITIAFLGGIESLLSALIGDGMIGGRHKSNCELVAQGVANFGSVLFGGIPATGAIARTATNVKTGAQTPLAGMIHAAVLLFILLFLSPIVSQVPLAALSAVLVMISWNMSEASHFIRLLKGPFGDRLVLIATFLLTVFVDITIAITVGMILACFVFMKQMSKMAKIVPLAPLFQETDSPVLKNRSVPEGVQIYEIQGPFFFGAANILKDTLEGAGPMPKTFILRLHSVPMIDASGMHAMKEFYDRCQKLHISLYLTEMKEHTKKDLKKFGLLDQIGENHLFHTLDEALNRTEKL